MTVGFALFAIFFGAGNLIFPPYLGFSSGDGWLGATVGFIVTDAVLAMAIVVVTTKLGGHAEDIGRRVSPWFGKSLVMIAILLIATFIAVPRTAATVHEIVIAPNFPGVSPIWTSIVFFVLTLFFVFNEGKVMDMIGTILTPVLLVTLALFIVWVIIHPPGDIIASVSDQNHFVNGLTEGYQTMDALGAPLMAGIIVSDFIRRGYTNKTERYQLVKLSGLVALALLIFIYGGLTYAGATMGNYFPADVSRVTLLFGTFAQVSGNVGAMILAVIVTAACLTTAVGLSATCGDFFHTTSNHKLQYKPIVLTSIAISFLISLFTVDEIIVYAGPILSMIYPVMMALVVLSAVDQFIQYDWIYIGAVVGALSMSVLENMAGIMQWQQVTDTLNRLVPLASLGFGWVVPSAVCAIVLGVISHLTGIGKTRQAHLNDRMIVS